MGPDSAGTRRVSEMSSATAVREGLRTAILGRAGSAAKYASLHHFVLDARESWRVHSGKGSKASSNL